jgi:tetratricopeptide (TPR) repeat protein
MDVCRCGFDRRSVPIRMREVQVGRTSRGAATRTSTRRLRYLLGTSVIVALVALAVFGLRGWTKAGTIEPTLWPERSAPVQIAAEADQPLSLELVPRAGEPLGPTPQDWQAARDGGSFDTLSPTDRDTALRVAKQLSERGEVNATDIVQAETLFRRYPAEPIVAQLLRSVLGDAADQHRSRGDFSYARSLLERALSLFPDDKNSRRSYLLLLVEISDWPATETAAQQVLAKDPAFPEARSALALSLAGQGRDKDALRALYSALEVVKDTTREPQLKDLRDQIERRLWVSSGCDNSQLPDQARTGDEADRLEKFLALVATCVGGNVGQRLSRFDVAYRRMESGIDASGGGVARIESAEMVGRDVLSVLERGYSTLARVFDHSMTHTIPVVVLETPEYQMTTGAPWWTNSWYDNEDATITIPTGYFSLEVNEEEEAEWCRARKFPDDCWQRRLCLSVARVDDDSWDRCKSNLLEMVLMHETTHAFTGEMTRGYAPDEISEGLAEYMKREVTRNRVDLSTQIEADVERVARWLFPEDDAEAGGQRRHFRDVTLNRILEQLRTSRTAIVDTTLTVYLGGELFVDYLVNLRSMGGIQRLLKTIGAQKSVDAGFEEVFGRGYEGTRREWLDWLRMRWGVGAPRR